MKVEMKFEPLAQALCKMALATWHEGGERFIFRFEAVQKREDFHFIFHQLANSYKIIK